MRGLIVIAVVGACAQLVDGALGMGYGLTSSTLLLAAGMAPAVASASVHLAEVGTTLAAGTAHWRLGNVDWRIVAIMAVPGGLCAFLGAQFLTMLPGEVARPWVACLLLGLGCYVVWRFLCLAGRRPQFGGRLSPRFLVPLAAVAGTMDAVGGGGWGPVGTTSLLSSGRVEPRKVIGSVDTAEFVVAVGGSIGFLTALGTAGIDFLWVGTLLVGGLVAAPIAAYVVRFLPARILGVAAGGVIVLTNVKTVAESQWTGLAQNGAAVWAIIGLLALAWMVALTVTVVAHRREAEPVEPAGDGEKVLV